MIKKMLDSSLHGTRGIKNHTNYGLTGRTITGGGFSNKANMNYKYVNRNTEGVTNTIEWISK